MKLSNFTLIIIAIYSCIIYAINVTIGLYAGIMTLAFLIVVLPIITSKERRMSDSEMEIFGKMKVNYGGK